MLPARRQAGGLVRARPPLGPTDLARRSAPRSPLWKRERDVLGPIRGGAPWKKNEIGFPGKPGIQRSLVAILGEYRFETWLPGEFIEQF